MLKQMKLATKTAAIVSMVLVVIFTIFIVCTAVLTSSALTQAISSEFSITAEKNAVSIQAVFDTTSATANNLQRYLRGMFAEYYRQVTSGSLDRSSAKSMIYGKDILRVNQEQENYIIYTVQSTVKDNDFIKGIGVYFEPFAFDKSIEHYNFYIRASNLDEYEILNSYESYSNQIYYQTAKDTKKPYFTPPYESQGTTIISAAYPIVSDGVVQGVISVDIDTTRFADCLNINTQYPSMYSTIYTEDGTTVYDSQDATFVGVNLASYVTESDDQLLIDNSFNQGQEFHCIVMDDNVKSQFFFYPITAGEQIWWSLTAIQMPDMNKGVTTMVIWLIIIAVISFAIITCVTVLVLRQMINPIGNVVTAAENIAKGEFDIDLDVKSQDEIGILSRTFYITAENIKTIIHDVKFILESMANGNFQVKTHCEDRYVGDYQEILLAIRSINNRLSSTLAQINEASDQVSAGSDQVSSGSQALAHGATEQASSLEELSATIIEISEQIKHNADHAVSAREQAVKAGDDMMDSSRKMREMIIAMNNINEKSGEISKIIKTIDDIAFQTNILALNAAVEAARAGDAGKGFAVVADEVRNLAGKSAVAAKDTAVLIQEAIQAVEHGVNMADETSRSILTVMEGSKTVTGLVNEIAAASNHQSDAVVQITLGVDQISSVVQTNSATAEESAAASEELNGQAQMLKQLVGQFKLKKLQRP